MNITLGNNVELVVNRIAFDLVAAIRCYKVDGTKNIACPLLNNIHILS